MKRITTYGDFADAMQRGSGAVHEVANEVLLRLAGELDGRTALAVSCAVRGELPERAAAHCGCTITELDTTIAFFVRRLSAGRRKVAA